MMRYSPHPPQTKKRNSSACNPEWAAISYGALVCIKCSGRHRSLGVAVSQVRSVAMDHWTYREVVSMLEGGNSQLSNFFGRHALTKSEFEKRQQKKKKLEQQQRNQQQQFVSNHHRTTSTIASTNTKATTTIKNITTSSTKSITMENVTELRYKTKAALFYKNQLEAHVGRLLAEDPTQNKLNGSARRQPYQGRSRSRLIVSVSQQRRRSSPNKRQSDSTISTNTNISISSSASSCCSSSTGSDNDNDNDSNNNNEGNEKGTNASS